MFLYGRRVVFSGLFSASRAAIVPGFSECVKNDERKISNVIGCAQPCANWLSHRPPRLQRSVRVRERKVSEETKNVSAENVTAVAVTGASKIFWGTRAKIGLEWPGRAGENLRL